MTSVRDTITQAVNDTKPKKHSHAEVDYQTKPHGNDRCRTCKAYINTKPPSCKKVKSPIQPNGWCRDGVDAESGRAFDPTFKD